MFLSLIAVYVNKKKTELYIQLFWWYVLGWGKWKIEVVELGGTESRYISKRVKKFLTRWKRERYRLAHFNSAHGRKKKSITYCNVENEILRLIKHSSLACHGREGHRGKKETRRGACGWTFPWRQRFPAKVFQPGRTVFQSRTSVWEKALRVRARERVGGRKRYLVARLAVRARREIAEAIHESSSDIEQVIKSSYKETCE